MSGKSDCESLLAELLLFAEKMLSEYGEFHPFGGYLKNSGDVVHVGAEDVSAEGTVKKLRQEFKRLAKENAGKAFGIVTNVMLPLDSGAKTDAIEFDLEHRDGYCAEVFYRYSLEGGFKIIEITAQRGEVCFFQ